MPYPIWYQRGLQYLHDGDYSDAADTLGAAIERGQRDPDILAAYASAAYHLKDYAAASQAAKLSLQRDPENKMAQSILGFSQSRLGETVPMAADVLSSMQDSNAKGGDSASRAGAAPQPGGNGITPLHQAAKSSAELTRAAEAKLRVRDFNAAADLATKAVKANPDNAQAYNDRATAYNRLGFYDRALADADEALHRFPDNPAALLNRVFALNKLHRFDEARRDAERVVAPGRDDVAAFLRAYGWLMKSYAEAGLGRREDMTRALEAAVKLQPGFQRLAQGARQAPTSGDALFLFDQFQNPSASGPAEPSGARPAREGVGGRRSLLGMIGGGLLALGLLAWLSRERWTTAVRGRGRSDSGGDAEPGPADAARTGAGSGLTPSAGSGFAVGYEAVRELGAGGMGIVYEAKDLGLDRRVAVKRMREEIRRDPRERKRFVSEARMVAKLRHPGIVEIFSIMDDADELYLVFEFVDGETLLERIRREGRLPFEEARRVLRGVCEAVDYAHGLGVVHRDLKPSNVMLSAAGEVKVMDFGIARQAKESLTKLAVTNTVAGTPAYMAPEQEEGRVGKQTDVFALGVCLYEMLTGECPFEGQGAGMHYNKIQGRFTPLSRRFPGMPAELEAVVAKALAPDPERRFRSPAEFAAALDAITPAPVS